MSILNSTLIAEEGSGTNAARREDRCQNENQKQQVEREAESSEMSLVEVA